MRFVGLTMHKLDIEAEHDASIVFVNLDHILSYTVEGYYLDDSYAEDGPNAHKQRYYIEAYTGSPMYTEDMTAEECQLEERRFHYFSPYTFLSEQFAVEWLLKSKEALEGKPLAGQHISIEFPDSVAIGTRFEVTRYGNASQSARVRELTAQLASAEKFGEAAWDVADERNASSKVLHNLGYVMVRVTEHEGQKRRDKSWKCVAWNSPEGHDSWFGDCQNNAEDCDHPDMKPIPELLDEESKPFGEEMRAVMLDFSSPEAVKNFVHDGTLFGQLGKLDADQLRTLVQTMAEGALKDAQIDGDETDNEGGTPVGV